MSPMIAALPIRMLGIEKRYGPVNILRSLDMDVAAGEFLTLLGPSGSGKTTLLMIVAGFVRANAGSIKFGDEEIVTTPPHRRNIGMVFQNYALFPHMTVFENIYFPLKQRGVSRSNAVKRVSDALEMVRLENLGERRIDQLSGGQRQRVALARALVFEPRVVLMDEPLSALDKGLRDHMQIEIRDLHRKLGMTTIYVTHDQREAITMSDRIAVMNKGDIEQVDTPEGLYSRPRTQFVAGFIGESNFLPVECHDGVARFQGQKINTSSPPSAVGKSLLVIRPERVRRAVKEDRERGANVFRGTMGGIIYQGDSFVCDIRLEGGHAIKLRDYCRGNVLADLPDLGGDIEVAVAERDAILVSAA